MVSEQQRDRKISDDISDAFSGTYVEYMGHLKLAPMKLFDIEEMSEWPRFEEKSLAWANFPVQTSELRKRWYTQQQKPHLQWIIIRDQKTDQLIGRCSLSDPLTGDAVMYGIVIHPDKLGQGLGTLITKIMIQYIFEVSSVNEIWLESRYDNIRAQKTWEKIGFNRQGRHFRREIFGRYDQYIGYQLKREDVMKLDLPSIDVSYLD